MTYSTVEVFENFARSFKRDVEYLERTVKEQQEIIEQLTGTGKPKGYVYMHPMDVAEYVERVKFCEVINWAAVASAQPNSDHLLELNGRLIKQSPYIPAVTQSLK